MKKLDLNGLGVQEMNAEEMRKTEGGSWLSAAVAWVGDAAGDAWDWVKSRWTGSGFRI